MHMNILNVLVGTTGPVFVEYVAVNKKMNILMVSKALSTASFSVFYS